MLLIQLFLLALPLACMACLIWLVFRTGLAGSAIAAIPRGLILWGLAAAVMVEGLSAFAALTQIGLALAWVAVIFLSLGLANSLARRGRRPPDLTITVPDGTAARFGASVVVVSLGLTALVATFTPPQTWDSLNYHLPRIAHWAQQASVQHFPTGIEVQNSRPPGGEYLMLHTYLLSGGDHFLSFVGWFAFLGSLLMVGLIARELRANDSVEWLAVVFGATLPMAIIQASGTANDVVVALWVLVFAWHVVRLQRKRRIGIQDFPFLGGAAGLAILTKPTALPYLIPFGIWAIVRFLRTMELRRVVVGGSLVLLVAGALSVPYLARNLWTYGAILQQDQVEIHSNQLRTPAGVLSNLLKNSALHASTPVPHLNKAVFLVVAEVHRWMGLDPNDPRTTAHRPFRVHSFSTHEERSGNPLHALLIGLVCVWLAAKRRVVSPAVLIYAAGTASSFLLFSYLFQWQIFGSRYHLPFFLLWAPVVGYVSDRWTKWQGATLVAALAVASIPWLVSIRSRPLFPLPGQASAPSVLTADRETLMFTNGENLQRPYVEMADLIQDRSCQRVGLALAGSGAEYPIWSLLGAPDADLRMEWLITGTPSDEYSDPAFTPCAVICQRCADDANFVGLSPIYKRGGFKLFLDEK